VKSIFPVKGDYGSSCPETTKGKSRAPGELALGKAEFSLKEADVMLSMLTAYRISLQGKKLSLLSEGSTRHLMLMILVLKYGASLFFFSNKCFTTF
jgi:hypothetical protein